MNKLLLMIFLIFIAVNIYAKVDYEVLWEKDLDLPDYIKNMPDDSRNEKSRNIYLSKFEHYFLIGYNNMIYLIDKDGKEYFRKEFKIKKGLTLPSLKIIGNSEVYVILYYCLDYKTYISKYECYDIKGNNVFETTLPSKYWQGLIEFEKDNIIFQYIDYKAKKEIIEIKDVRLNLLKKIEIDIDSPQEWSQDRWDNIELYTFHKVKNKFIYYNYWTKNWGIKMIDFNGKEIYRNIRDNIYPEINVIKETDKGDKMIIIGESSPLGHKNKYLGIMKNDTFIYENYNFSNQYFEYGFAKISNNGRYILFPHCVFDVVKKQKINNKFGPLFDYELKFIDINDSGIMFISNRSGNATMNINYGSSYTIIPKIFTANYYKKFPNMVISENKSIIYIFDKYANFFGNIVFNEPVYEFKCIDIDKLLLTLKDKIQMIKIRK